MSRQMYSIGHEMHPVIVYSSNRCSTCQMVKGFLSLRGVPFVEKNISKDLTGRAELLALGFDSTPVTIVGKRCISGFDAAQIDEALAALTG